MLYGSETLAASSLIDINMLDLNKLSHSLHHFMFIGQGACNSKTQYTVHCLLHILCRMLCTTSQPRGWALARTCQVEVDLTRRRSTVADLRRHSILSQAAQGSEESEMLLSTPQSRLELLDMIGLNREEAVFSFDLISGFV